MNLRKSSRGSQPPVKEELSGWGHNDSFDVFAEPEKPLNTSRPQTTASRSRPESLKGRPVAGPRKQSFDVRVLERPNTMQPFSNQGKRPRVPYLCAPERKYSTTDLKNLMTFLQMDSSNPIKYDNLQQLQSETVKQLTLPAQTSISSAAIHSFSKPKVTIQPAKLLYMNSDRCLHQSQGIQQYLQLHLYHNLQPAPKSAKRACPKPTSLVPSQKLDSMLTRVAQPHNKPRQNILEMLQERKDMKKYAGTMIDNLISKRETDESMNEFIKLELNCLSDISQRKKKISNREKNLKRKFAQIRYKVSS